MPKPTKPAAPLASPVPVDAHAVLHEAIGFMSARAFGAALKKLGWSPERAASMLGYEPWAVKRWKNGDDPVPWLVARTLELYDENPKLERQPQRVTRFDNDVP